MKRLILLFALVAISFPLFAQQGSEKDSTVVVFDKKSFDFGDVLRENKNYTCTFLVENRGETPLVLLSVNTSCSCLKAHYSRRPIKSGQSSEITMTLEAGKMDFGIFHRVVEVHTNVGVHRIIVKGNSVGKR